MLRTPPCLCAKAAPATNIATRNGHAVSARRSRRISGTFLCRRGGKGLFVEPDVFHAPAVEDAVDHDRQALDPGLLAGPAAAIEDDRPGVVLRQLALDRPQQPLAPVQVGLTRLLLDQLVHLGIAVAIPVDVRTAAVKQL